MITAAIIYVPPIDLYLNIEKSNWKTHVQRTGFLACKEATQYTGSKNSVGNKIKIQFVELDFSKLILQKSNTDQQSVRHVPFDLKTFHRSWLDCFFISLYR